MTCPFLSKNLEARFHNHKHYISTGKHVNTQSKRQTKITSCHVIVTERVQVVRFCCLIVLKDVLVLKMFGSHFIDEKIQAYKR